MQRIKGCVEGARKGVGGGVLTDCQSRSLPPLHPLPTEAIEMWAILVVLQSLAAFVFSNDGRGKVEGGREKVGWCAAS